MMFSRSDRNMRFSISFQSIARLARVLGLAMTRAFVFALADLAVRHLPEYEPDEGPLSAATLTQIRRRVRQGNMKVHESLF